jgi:hypothetical protein
LIGGVYDEVKVGVSLGIEPKIFDLLHKIEDYLARAIIGRRSESSRDRISRSSSITLYEGPYYDGWGTALQYQSCSLNDTLKSYGADRREGDRGGEYDADIVFQD